MKNKRIKILFVILALLGAAGLMTAALCTAAALGRTSASVGIIGGADGPTAIFVASRIGGGVLWPAALMLFVCGVIGLLLLARGRRKK